MRRGISLIRSQIALGGQKKDIIEGESILHYLCIHLKMMPMGSCIVNSQICLIGLMSASLRPWLDPKQDFGQMKSP